jgi:hypothetical protein
LKSLRVHHVLRRLLLQGALRVALLAIATAGVVGFLSLIARASQLPTQTIADAKAPSRTCMPSNCYAKQRPCAKRRDEGLRCNRSARLAFLSDLWLPSIFVEQLTS